MRKLTISDLLALLALLLTITALPAAIVFFVVLLALPAWAGEPVNYSPRHGPPAHVLSPPPVVLPGMPITGAAIYSPTIVDRGAQRWICVGGWKTVLQLSDTIYCGQLVAPERVASLFVAISPWHMGFEQVNDPSVICWPDGHCLMYFTGVALGLDGWIAANDKLYWSYSPDMVNWSQPQLLLDDMWLPSVRLINGDVILWATSNRNGGVYQFNLGPGGLLPIGRIAVSTPGFWYNVDVSLTNRYQMLADSPQGIILGLSDPPGTHFLLVGAVPIPHAPDHQVLTPAWAPDGKAFYYADCGPVQGQYLCTIRRQAF